LCAIPLTGHPDRFQSLKSVYVRGVFYEIESVWYHKEQPIFKFRGVNSISEAEKLAGGDVCVAASERAPLEDGEYYYSDLTGCRMVDDASGEPIGTVSGWQELTPDVREGPVLLEVDEGRGGEPLLVPFARTVLKRVDLAAREIRVELPEGLRDLNAEPRR
jgi:16S rRNA processing protein RimM